MDLQMILVAVVALGAVLYLGRAVWRTWAGSGCGGGCGCGPKKREEPKLIAAEELLVGIRSAQKSDSRRLREDVDCDKSGTFSA
jgi:hypothetical protein